MLWQVTVASTGPRPDLDWTSTRQGWGSTGKRKLLEEREGFCASLDRTLTGQGKPVDRFPNRLTGSPTG